MRPQFEAERRARRVPESIVIGGLHAKRVSSRRNVRVVGGAPRSGIGPAVVEALEHVAVAHFLRRHKTQPRVVEFESAHGRPATFSQESAPLQWLVTSSTSKRSSATGGGTSSPGSAPDRPPPVPSAWQTTDARRASATPKDGCWLPSRGCAARRRCQTRSSASNPALRPCSPSQCSRSAQCRRPSQTRDALARRREWRESPSAQAVLQVHGELLAIPHIPPMVLGADQQRSIGARQQGRHHVARKPIRRGEVGDRVAMQSREPGQCRHPQVAACVASHGAHQVAAQPVGLRVGLHVCGLRRLAESLGAGRPVRQPAPRADPQRAVGVDQQRTDKVVGQAIGRGERVHTIPANPVQPVRRAHP